MASRSSRRPAGIEGKDMFKSVAQTKGNLDSVTIKPMMSANGSVYSPVVIFSGKYPYLRRLENVCIEKLHGYLPDCYLHSRNPARVEFCMDGQKGFGKQKNLDVVARKTVADI